MRRVLVLLMTAVPALSAAAVVVAASNGNDGPAPSAGDGGSRFAAPIGPNSDGTVDALGLAPNSGDGVSDSSGLETPNSPTG